MTTGWLRSPNGEVAVDKPRIGSKKRWGEMNLPNYSIGRHRQLGSPANLTGIPFPDIVQDERKTMQTLSYRMDFKHWLPTLHPVRELT